MNLVPFKAIYPNLSLISSPDSFFGEVKSQFSEYKSSGFFKKVEEDSIYIYQLEVRETKHQGVISCTDINVIKKHPSFYQVAFENTGEVHTIWKVSSVKLVNEFVQLFKDIVPISYIADGHHRVKTCQLLNATNKKNEVVNTKLKSVLSLYFSWDQLDIYDYNRSVDAFVWRVVSIAMAKVRYKTTSG